MGRLDCHRSNPGPGSRRPFLPIRLLIHKSFISNNESHSLMANECMKGSVSCRCGIELARLRAPVASYLKCKLWASLALTRSSTRNSCALDHGRSHPLEAQEICDAGAYYACSTDHNPGQVPQTQLLP